MPDLDLYVLPSMAFYALPALLAMAAIRRSWRRPVFFGVMLGVGALMLALMGEIPVALRPGSTWTLIEVGGSRGLINGLLPESNTTTIEIVLRGAGLLAFALALLSLRGQGTSVPPARAESTAASLPHRVLDAVRRIPITPCAPLIVYLVAYLLVANVLWMYNDRYFTCCCRSSSHWRLPASAVASKCHKWRGSRRPCSPSWPWWELEMRCVSMRACVIHGRRSLTAACNHPTSTPGTHGTDGRSTLTRRTCPAD